jgi:hypothetical protein
MLNCQTINFSSNLSKQRMDIAGNILGEKIVKYIIAFSLYLCGARRRHIAESLRIPHDTLKSFIKRVLQNGMAAFEDRRQKTSSFLPNGAVFPGKPKVALIDEEVIIDFGVSRRTLKIPACNVLQIKTILLTMLDNKLITAPKVAEILGCSPVHILRLSHALEKGDVHSLMDKRQGQKKDYLFSPQIKAELLQQFAANAISGKPTSSRLISQQIAERCQLNLADRSIRHHMKKMGLGNIVKSLPRLVDTLKKTALDDPQNE